MESQLFREMVQKSLDNDLADMLYNNRVSVQAAMDLQMLRLMRGRHFQVNETSVQGWSADGVKWEPREPGNSTTSEGSQEQGA